MALASTAYRKIERKQFAQSVRKITPENQYWNAFKPKYKDDLHKNIPFVRFSLNEPYDFVTCSNYDVRVFRSETFKTYKKLGFRGRPLVCDIRKDNKLLAIGGTNGLLRLYNNSQTSGLKAIRSLHGHKDNVYQLKFKLSDSTKLISFSNDKTIKFWDIITPQLLVNINGHNDFIRTGDWLWDNDNQNNLIISASYDHYCKLWDLRNIKTVSNNGIHRSEVAFNHNLPIESCLSIPHSDLIAIAGGPSVSIWSIRKADKPITVLTLHRKSVTSLAVNSSGSRLLTGCLDNNIRIFNAQIIGSSIFENSHVFRAPSSVLSLDMCHNDQFIVAGTLKHGIIGFVNNNLKGNKTLDKYLTIQQYENDPIAEYDNDIKTWMETRNKLKYMTEQQAFGQEEYIKYGSKDWHLRGQKLKLPVNVNPNVVKPQTQQLDVTDITPTTMLVRFKNRSKMKQYDIALKQFRYYDALDCALKAKDTLTVHSVLEDLWRREGLCTALGGRNDVTLIPILEYLIYSLPHPHLTQTSLHVTAIIIDLYSSHIGISSATDNLFQIIYKQINNMILKYKILLKLQGSLDMILSAQDIKQNPLPLKLLKLSEKINKIMQKTKAKYDNNDMTNNNDIDIDNDNNDSDNDGNQTHDKMAID